MLLKLTRWVRGYVDFCAYGKFPERFINLTSKNGIYIWNSKPTETGFSASMFLYDYKNIRTTARKSKLKTKVTKRNGLPFLIRKYNYRIGLLIGSVIGFLLILVLSEFIWSVEVTPTENISESTVIELLEENGVGVGAYKGNIDVQAVERNSILSCDKIGWMSINMTGNCISVKLIEKIPKPETPDEEIPCNIRASADGVITQIKANKGVTKVLKGSGVAKGELLVSGIVESKLETLKYVRASAEVYADVNSEHVIKIPKSTVYNSISENKTDRHICRFICFEFPCTLNFNNYDDYLYQYQRENIYINQKKLPITIITQTQNEVIKKDETINKKQAEQIALDKAVLYEVFTKPDSVLKSRKIKIMEEKNSFTAHVTYCFNENIAQTSEFSVTD
ncbi:MAG: sporulation protein YqfD [Ruminococcus sp.]|nr:sporulation protein YqfD [Ruminococcus sp.]